MPESARARTTRSNDVTRWSAVEVARRIAAGELSAREAVEACVRRIEAVNGRLNALVVPLFEQARAEADLADARRARGERLGPLHGVPITVKESFDLAGTPSTGGLPHRAGHRATTDAPLVARLRRAGAVVLGKTNVSQFLAFVESDNPVYGRCNNPWGLDRTPGGSTGGEAAILAAGGATLGLATDIGGSLRVPAHFCGVTGLKATSGRLSLAGTVNTLFFPGQEAIVDAAGPLGRSVADVRLALALLAAAGPEPADPAVPPVPLRDPGAVPLRGLRVAYYTDDGFFTPAPAVRRAVREAAEALEARGALVEEFRPPDVAHAMRLYYRLLTADGGAWARRVLSRDRRDPRIASLMRLVALPRWSRPPLSALAAALGQRGLAELVPSVGGISTDEYWQAVSERALYRARFLASLDAARADAVVCPVNGLPALTHGRSRDLLAAGISYTALYNLLGMPAGVVPAVRVAPGEETDRPPSRDRVEQAARAVETGSAGLPIGVQVAARHWREDVALAVMAVLEEHFRARPDYPAQPAL